MRKRIDGEDGFIVTGREFKSPLDKSTNISIDSSGQKVPDLNFTEATSITKPGRTSMKFLNRVKDLADIDESGDFVSEKDIKDAMKLANRLYELDGVVANTIDLFTDFAISDFKFSGVKNDKLLDILEDFKRNVNKGLPNDQRGLKKFGETATNQTFLLGNVFAEPKWLKKDIVHNTGKVKQYKTISSVYFYDPQTITFQEGFGNIPLLVSIQPEVYQAIQQYRNGRDLNKFKQDIADFVRSLPKRVIDSAQRRGYQHYIGLDGVVRLQRKKAPYNIWGTPYVVRAFGSLAIKHKLRNLDMETIEGLINTITIFRIGTKDNIAKTARLNAFRSLMTDSPRSRYLVWAHDVDVISAGPQRNILEMVDRYRQINAEILEDLGVPKAFTVGGKEGGAGDPWIQILQLMERLTRHRRSLSNIIEDWCEEIALENGFKPGKDFYNISIKWKRNNLMNPADVRNFVLAFFDRGLISKETALWLNDENLVDEIDSRIFEASQKFQLDGEDIPINEIMVPPTLPFSKDSKLEDGKETSEDNARPTKDKEKDKVKDETTINDKES